MPVQQSHWSEKSEHLCFIACEEGVNRKKGENKNPQTRLVLAHVVNNQ